MQICCRLIVLPALRNDAWALL